MKQTTEAEIHILDRLLYLLEETSVSYLAQQDKSFANYVDSLYTSIHNKSVDMRKAAIT